MRFSREELLTRLTALNDKMKTRVPQSDTAKIEAYLQKCADLLDHTKSWTAEALESDKQKANAALTKNQKAFFPKQTIVNTCALLVDCHIHRLEHENEHKKSTLAKIRAGETAKDQARRDAAEKARLAADAEKARAEEERLKKAAEEKAQLEAAANAEALRTSEERIRQENERVAADEETRKQLELQKAAEKAARLAKITTGIASLKAEYVRHGGSNSKSEVQFNLRNVNTKDTEAMSGALVDIVKRLRDAGPNGASSKTLPNAEKLAGELGIALPARAAVTPQGKNASSFLPWKKSKPVETAAAAQSSLASTPTP